MCVQVNPLLSAFISFIIKTSTVNQITASQTLLYLPTIYFYIGLLYDLCLNVTVNMALQWEFIFYELAI